VRWGLFALFLGQLCWFMAPIALGSSSRDWSLALSSSITWLLWFGLLSLMKRLQGGYQHPPTDDVVLSRGRRWVGWLCAVCFVVLFMPAPLTHY